MTPPGLPHHNTRAGETMSFLSAPEDRVQRFLLDLAPVFHGPPPHRHPLSTVAAGSLAIRLGATWRDLGPGETVVVPPGAVHTYANTWDAPVSVQVELDPGTAMRGFFEALYGLAEAGMLTETGGLRPTQAATLFRRFPDAMTIVGPPAAIQPALWWAISRFDRG